MHDRIAGHRAAVERVRGIEQRRDDGGRPFRPRRERVRAALLIAKDDHMGPLLVIGIDGPCWCWMFQLSTKSA